MTYRLTRRAAAGLRKILVRLEESSPRIAVKWRTKFRLTLEHIGEWPNTGHRYFGMEDLPVRVRTVGPYLIFFKPETKPVEIVAIEHGAQNLSVSLHPTIEK